MDQDDNKLQEQQSAEKAGQVVGRAAADYFTGGEYEQLRNKPIVGDAAKKAEEEVGRRIAEADKRNGGQFGKIAKKADDAGLLDAANKAGDMYGSSTGGGTPGKNSGLEDKPNNVKLDVSLPENQEKNDMSSQQSFQGDGENSEKSDSQTFKMSPDAKRMLVGNGLLFLGFIIVFVLIIAILFSVGDVFSGFVDGVVDFFSKDQQELEKKYYEKLVETQNKINGSENVCIDANLITAALTYNKTFDVFNEEGNETVSSANDDVAVDDTGDAIDYKKMAKQVELLGYMQLKHIKYGWDNRLSSGGGYCKTRTETTGEEVVSSATINNLVLEGIFRENGLDSSSAELVARHDATGFTSFLRKKSKNEKNYEYVMYQPAASEKCDCQLDPNTGNCIPGSKVNCRDNCNATLPSDKAELSIGEEDDILNTADQSVFYWNLVNSFIPEYYDDYLPPESNSEERTRKILEIADGIYSLYKDMGPSHTCTSQSYFTTSSSSLCTNGITMVNEDGSVEVIDFEDYVAGVVARENNWHQGDNIENLKAQAIASRTYALAATNSCSKSIKNSQSQQTYKKTEDPYILRAVQETRGVVVRKNGQIISTQYDAFCVKSVDGDIYTIRQQNQQIPKSFLQTMKISQSKTYADIDYCYGHGYGMSQIGSRYLQTQGYTYDKILAYYYGEDIELNKSMAANLTVSNNIATERIDKILLEHGSSIEELNAYIASNVRSAGVGTRDGVVAAAISLIQGFEDRTGMRLPYQWGGTRQGVYGAVGSWAKGTTSKNGQGLDCSGFVSWAIFNGGYTYDYRTSGPWANAGVRRSWTTGMYDDKAQPGDLIGSPGHIQMIVGVTDTGYIVAEASSWANGLRIKQLPFKSGGQMELVDMSNYYATHPRQSSYPG